MVDVRDEHFHSKGDDDQTSQGDGCRRSKRYKEQLSKELLSRGKDLVDLACDRVRDFLVPDVLFAVDLERPNIFDVPPHAQVELTDLPKLDKNNTP